MRLSRSYPEIENLHILEELYQKGQPAMFVANHCSWMDIPFLGATVGWRNYKLVSKKELGIVPILGTSIKIGGHIMVDRTDRRSQLKTLKQGINYFKKVSLLGTDSLVFLLIDIQYLITSFSIIGRDPFVYFPRRDKISHWSSNEVQKWSLQNGT